MSRNLNLGLGAALRLQLAAGLIILMQFKPPRVSFCKHEVYLGKHERGDNMQEAPVILIVDDDPHLRESVREILEYHKYACREARDGKEALDILAAEKVDLALLDLQMPRIDGLEVLKRSMIIKPDLPVIMISLHGTIGSAVEATKLGAYDFIEKPLEAERMLLTIRNALHTSRLREQRDHLLAEVKQRYRMIGSDEKIQNVFALIERAATVDSKVLITGESGVGKDLVARAIHYNSSRAEFPFVVMNCSAIPETLIESELFGYKKGAFSGADHDHPGRFQQAHRGTLFFDEIADMSLMMQAKVLRVLEDGAVMMLGSAETRQVDVRLIAATNKDLQQEIENGNFRSDLYYRLNVIPIHVPPLRERKEDIQPLAEYFLEEICRVQGLSQKCFAGNVWPLLQNHQWPGNVRELNNVVERAAVLSFDRIIDAALLREALQAATPQPPAAKSTSREQTLEEARAAFERAFILKKLNEHDWEIIVTAEALGINRTSLWKKMQMLGIKK